MAETVYDIETPAEHLPAAEIEIVSTYNRDGRQIIIGRYQYTRRMTRLSEAVVVGDYCRVYLG